MISASRTHAYVERMREAMSAFIGAVFLVAAASAAAEDPPGTGPQVKVAGLIEAPLDEVRGVLLDLERFGRWFPRTSEWRVLERDATGARVYGRQTLPWPLRDRDYVVDYRWWDGPDGGFRLEATGLSDAAPAAPERVVRIDSLRSLWTLSAEGPRTRASYLYEGPSVGRLLDWLARIGAEERTRDVIDGLADEVARRRTP